MIDTWHLDYIKSDLVNKAEQILQDINALKHIYEMIDFIWLAMVHSSL